jgi:uncharacterized surface protein with fasciclin (FAS1) repeats
MKIISNLRKIALFAFIATVSFTSCNSDDEVAVLPVDNSIVGIAQRTADLSILVQALGKTGLVTTLGGNDPYTVFAPNNDAFNAFLLANNYPNLDAVPVPALKEILLNHVIVGKKTSTDLTTGYLKTLAKGSASATNTLSMFVNTANGVRLNGVSTVTTPNIAASNGVIHIVDAVIGLPTIVTHVKANFTTLFAVVTSTTGTFGDQSVVANALTTNTSPLTLFAPTNAALATATGTGGFANGATAAQVTKVLLYHATGALGGNILSSSLSNNLGSIPMATNPVQNTTVSITGGAKIIDQASNNCNITILDIQCTNGIIHGIDRVLQPAL